MAALRRCLAGRYNLLICANTYAPIVLKQGTQSQTKVPVLCQLKVASFCSATEGPPITCNGANILKDGQDPILKPDSDYPDWLWKLQTKPLPLEEISKDDRLYWRRLSKMKIRRQNSLRKQGKF